MHERPHAPHGVDKGCRRRSDSFARVLGLLFGRDQETCGFARRYRRPVAERLCEALSGRLGFKRGDDF